MAQHAVLLLLLLPLPLLLALLGVLLFLRLYCARRGPRAAALLPRAHAPHPLAHRAPQPPPSSAAQAAARGAGARTGAC